MPGPSISRGEMYGPEEGRYSATAEASGPVEAGPSPAVMAIAILGILVVIRLFWESAD